MGLPALWLDAVCQRQTEFRLLKDNHDVESTRPSGIAGPRRRPSTRLRRRAQEMLPRLEILGPTRPEASLRRYHAPDGRGPTIVEKNICGSLRLPCALHQSSARWTPSSSHSRRCRRGWLDFDLFSRRTFPRGNPRSARPPVSCPVPRILHSPQISHRFIFDLSALARFRPHPLISPSRGSHCGRLRRSPKYRGYRG